MSRNKITYTNFEMRPHHRIKRRDDRTRTTYYVYPKVYSIIMVILFFVDANGFIAFDDEKEIPSVRLKRYKLIQAYVWKDSEMLRKCYKSWRKNKCMYSNTVRHHLNNFSISNPQFGITFNFVNDLTIDTIDFTLFNCYANVLKRADSLHYIFSVRCVVYDVPSYWLQRIQIRCWQLIIARKKRYWNRAIIEDIKIVLLALGMDSPIETESIEKSYPLEAAARTYLAINNLCILFLLLCVISHFGNA